MIYRSTYPFLSSIEKTIRTKHVHCGERDPLCSDDDFLSWLFYHVLREENKPLTETESLPVFMQFFMPMHTLHLAFHNAWFACPL